GRGARLRSVSRRRADVDGRDLHLASRRLGADGRPNVPARPRAPGRQPIGSDSGPLIDGAALLLELGVVEHAGPMELLQHRLEARLLEALRVRPKLTRIDPQLLQPLPLLLDADPSLRVSEGARAVDRPLLYEASVPGDQRDRHAERREGDDVA